MLVEESLSFNDWQEARACTSARTPLIPQPSSGAVGVVRQVWDAVDSWLDPCHIGLKCMGHVHPLYIQHVCVQQLL